MDSVVYYTVSHEPRYILWKLNDYAEACWNTFDACCRHEGSFSATQWNSDPVSTRLLTSPRPKFLEFSLRQQRKVEEKEIFGQPAANMFTLKLSCINGNKIRRDEKEQEKPTTINPLQFWRYSQRFRLPDANVNETSTCLGSFENITEVYRVTATNDICSVDVHVCP